jgi:bifunctional DNase/RNase
MDVMDVHHDLPATYPVISLQEVEPPLRHLTFPVGLPEATSLAYALRRIDTPRPLTHALLVDVLARFHVDVVAVRLVGRTGGTYLAELDLIGAKGREVVSCRPTDGLAVALRMPVPAPILCDERLLEGSGDVEPG